MTNIFKQIVAKESPAEIVFENPRLMVIKDINPLAPVHLLILPKREIKRFQDITMQDLPTLTEMLAVATQMARQFEIEDSYRLVTNNGADAGQSIDYLHFHLMGGKKLGPMA